jgi:hypothetical protein
MRIKIGVVSQHSGGCLRRVRLNAKGIGKKRLGINLHCVIDEAILVSAQ